MDYIAHIFWSAIIFTGPHVYLAIFFGVLPDTLPFGLHMIVSPIRSQRRRLAMERGQSKTQEERLSSMRAYYDQPDTRWVYKCYNYTHSLVIWAATTMIVWFFTRNLYSFPIYMLAWLLHILIDIPTHTKAFFAPQFLTPFSTFCVDGKSWARPTFMKINYTLILIFGTLRIIQQYFF